MILLIKEELHHFWQVREMMLARDIPTSKSPPATMPAAARGALPRAGDADR
jgi:tRNA isopentenyl-2-thiomethyl-A-37 hydroxylase MiaE